ncbi:hypothetical protein A1O1_05375 [Capronia coronata CBS 617.96]|uniref:Mucin n=1 Tax=Capronia coronata CBS 617.96 TaxID=1182541 RepID=W9YFL3_9EURO|nr:uncharacterized protein A1O1_05375 [Capronia coronata CBS 617.96]EXJ88445.1 hypothetical protein A1O1_05375 [Capronia coronata CBS 617.96]
MRTTHRRSLTNEVAFESLPPALRRKYFSSLERLRLAQDGSSPPHPRRPRPSILQPKSTGTVADSSDNSTILTAGIRQPSLLLPGNRLRKRRASSHNNQAAPSTVAWFASLPPAVQRRLFSKEECSFYTLGRNTIILDAADELLRRRSSHTKQSAAFEPRSSDDETVVDLEDRKDEERADSAIDMRNYFADGFRWLDDEAELDLKLDDYHEAIAETARRTASLSEPVRHPFRRNPSLSSLSVRPGRNSTSSPRSQVEPSSAPALPTKPIHSSSSTFSLRHLRSQASLSSIDPRATHYQDPSARMKLRLYLASPQKFDEAIEFGFPSVGQKTQQFDHTRPMTSPQPTPEVNRTFFRDDTPSLSGDDDDDVDEPDTLYDPRTPEDADFHMHRPSTRPSMDGSTGLRSPTTRRHPEVYARGVTADREMTLHMTLTRPDLRTPESQPIYKKSINELPLERPELVLDGQGITIWDTLPPEESRMKRFLRKLRLK